MILCEGLPDKQLSARIQPLKASCELSLSPRHRRDPLFFPEVQGNGGGGTWYLEDYSWSPVEVGGKN